MYTLCLIPDSHTLSSPPYLLTPLTLSGQMHEKRDTFAPVAQPLGGGRDGVDRRLERPRSSVDQRAAKRAQLHHRQERWFILDGVFRFREAVYVGRLCDDQASEKWRPLVRESEADYVSYGPSHDARIYLPQVRVGSPSRN